MKSFADYGHKTRLYSYDPDLNVPDGVELADASEIMPDVPDLTTYNGVAPFSDMFRLNMTNKTGEVWVDCDVAALKPMPDQPYIVAHMTRYVGNAVLRLPPESKALQGLLEFVNAEEPWLPADWPWKRFFPETVKLDNVKGDRILLDNDQRAEFPYMTYGPYALTYFLKKTRELKHVMPKPTFYPVHRIDLRQNYFRPRFAKINVPDECIAIHDIGGKQMRRKFDRMTEFLPPKGHSFIGKLCKKHGIDPMAAPAEVGRGLVEKEPSQA